MPLTKSGAKVMADMKLIEAMETLIDRMKKTKSNAEFLMSMGKQESF